VNMEVITQVRIMFDVDDTIIEWDTHRHGEITEKKGFITIDSGEVMMQVKPIPATIEAIKKHKGQGHHVTVWTAAGSDWAERVIKALKLEKYVDIVSSKPIIYYDDLPLDLWCKRKNLTPHGRPEGNFE